MTVSTEYPDDELRIDAYHYKNFSARIAVQGALPCNKSEERESECGSHKRGFNTKIHLAVDAHDLKHWKGVATGYAKNTASLLATVHIRSIDL
jgi:hypothetical protein